MSRFEEMTIRDGCGTDQLVCVEPNGGMAVNIQDQHTKAFDVFFSQTISSTPTLALDAVINDYLIVCSVGHGILAGEQLVISDSVSNRVFIGDVLGVSVNNISLDTPLNFSFPTATTSIVRSTKEMDVDGSVTRQTFAVYPPVDIDIDITRIMFKLISNDLPEMDMFGDIAGGLTRGVVLRSVNGENINYWNVKTNGELVNLMYDVKEFEAAKHGVNGLGGRLTYAGPSKHGVTIRLGQGETLEAIIQDDLTSLVSFRMIACGHLVGD